MAYKSYLLEKNQRKVNITKWHFYLFLVISSFYMLIISIQLINNIHISNIKQNLELTGIDYSEQTVNNLKRNYILSYITVCLFLITFIIYLIFAVSKVKIGYLFCTLWLIFFVGLGIAPIIYFKSLNFFTVILLVLMIASASSMFLVYKDIYFNRLRIQHKINRNRLKI